MRGNVCTFAAATAAPAEESDLAVLPSIVVEQRLAGGRKVESSTSDEGRERQDHRWTWFALAAALCLCGEIAALKGFRT
jgi:hypothetical protein